MKKVIALYGRSNVGKTATIKKFTRLLKEHYGDAIHIQKLKDHDPDWDVQLLVTIHGRLIVGIESQGDTGDRVWPSMGVFAEAACDIIFCATRTRGETCYAVESLMEKGYKLEWLKQIQAEGEEEQRESNERQAQELLKRLVLFEQESMVHQEPV